MIVPRPKLLFWVALIVLPFATLAGAVPGMTGLALGFVSVLVLVAMADALGSRLVLSDINVVLPEIVRLSKDRAAKLEVRIRNPDQKQRKLRFALALPRELESPQEEAQLELPAATEWSRFSWRCIPRQRGEYQIPHAYLETGSRLGFWAVRKTAAAKSQVRVYPNLFRDRRQLAALFLHRGMFGLHAQRQLGKGREFEKLREYVSGDAYDELHWKATARRGRPITKVFQLERTQEVYVVIDASRLSGRTVGRGSNDAGAVEPMALEPRSADDQSGTSILERYLTAALVLGLAAEQQGDLFGVLTFTNQVEAFVRARNGKAHYSACRDALYALQPKAVTPHYDEVFTFIRSRLRRRALLLFLTSLDDPLLAESFVAKLDLICNQHVILVNILQPPGIGPLFTDREIDSVDQLYQQLGGHLLWQKLRELEKVLKRRGVQFGLVKNERLSAELVSQYLNVKRRQLL